MGGAFHVWGEPCGFNTFLVSIYLGIHGKENLSSLHILAVYEDSDLNLWVATSRGLDRINHKTSRVDMRFTFSPRKVRPLYPERL